ncbi:similar to Saccharomyces cerevisiae YMR032W HOF1 Bud neck-localized, SH3 domain-containing protein required for cytokinesis [Maudiozyma saulgeensis]|uniref:Similar to Saccharomyces cerevisiae YMR032W HOF1 Bud neck-localized, SH3 domain-containing protein required for cytokinesis n=1 Tax=Maudiozyma saulgeensis TaxID=1789683 RepID=A0A1X7R7V8_9SACH|nr:similar to Saccharomyces cerevisiae YMR032W HOF1 Bud neck-localized, SH3 domain-containing protein required for cytokinesis [Kazachstania saulgeensis]
MNYDYKSCFWDPHDDGVNVLLTHIHAGIKSSGTVESFFRQRTELEKDYARRLGAINEKLQQNLQVDPEFGHLNKALTTLLEVEKAKAHAHSKQSEVIYRQAFSNTKLFRGELQARYTTLSGKIEKMRVDKFNKKKGCEELSNRLEKATVRARDLRLNQNNIIGSKRVEQNEKELAKWENNEQETKLQLNVLKQEYKASQRHWLHEWGDITRQLQEMEQARIQFIQAKLQVYIETCMETSILEQSKMDLLNSRLMVFTSIDDIAKFSSEHGTGRLKEKHVNKKSFEDQPGELLDQRSSNKHSPIDDNGADYRSSRVSYNHLGTDPYIDNIRKLSSNLQKRSQNRSSQYNKAMVDTGGLQNTNSNSDSTIKANSNKIYESPSMNKNNQYEDLMKNSEHRPITPPPEPICNTEVVEPLQEGEVEIPHSHKESSNSYTTSESSSNPTDFTTHLKKRESLESMTTSVSSMASTIGDAQRFSKSWNSSSRKRKSMNHINQLLNDEHDKNRQASTNTVINSQFGNSQSSIDSYARNHIKAMPNVKNTNDTRRKSMVLENSTNPIEDALYEMERLQGSTQANSKLGRIKDNGLIVTLPMVTRGGEPVIKYAKANFPLIDNGADELANFEKNDYILITEIISNDWYRGEVYDNERISPDHRDGLIPYNFVSILG